MSLDYAADGKSYSFGAIPAPQEPGTTASILTADGAGDHCNGCFDLHGPENGAPFRQTDPFQDSDHALGGTISGGVIAAVPAVFYVASLVRKDDYGQATSLRAGEAVVDDTVLMAVTKAITRRLRPSDIPVYGNYNDTFSAAPRNAGSGQ